MIWQELEPCWLDMRLQSVQFYTVAVVDENVLVLGYREVRVVLEEPMS